MNAILKRLFITLLALMIAVSLIACQPTADPSVGTEAPTEAGTGAHTEPPTDAETEAETEPQKKELVLFENGVFNFRVVRAEDMSNPIMASFFVNSLQSATGTSGIKLTTDESYTGNEYDPDSYDILFGDTCYPESEVGRKGLGFTGYKISVVDNKVVIAARNEDALSLAANDFAQFLEDNSADGRLAIGEDFCLEGSVSLRGFELITGEIPTVTNYADVKFSDCGDDYEQATLYGVEAQTFTDYCKTLEADGFELYAEYKMADDLYSTYVKDGLTVHAYHTAHNDEMRIIAFEDAPLPWETVEKYEKVCEPSITLMGLEKSGNTGGLGCVVRLEDGSFIIIDGGHDNSTEARDLYNTLIDLSVSNKIRIRAWVITHAHGDHYGAFVAFSQNFASDRRISVDSFIFNFCDTPEQEKHSSPLSFSATLNTIERYWEKATVYKGLTGQVYKFPGCEMEILYCMSDFLPSILGEEAGIPDIDRSKVDGNISNMTFRLKLAGQTFLVTGDASKVNCDEMSARYREYLKSDILTVPHHGHNENRYRARNGTVEFYTTVDPSIVLWPAGTNAQARRMYWNGHPGSNFEANYHLIRNLNVKELIVAGSTTRTIMLPYTGNR